MSFTRTISVARSPRRAAAALAVGALALGLAAVPAVATAATSVRHAAAPVGADIAVNGGATTFTVPAELLTALQAEDVTLMQVDDEGNLAPASTQSVTLGIESGRMASNSGKASGHLVYSGAGFAVVNAQTKKTVHLKNLEADLTKGQLLASVDSGEKVVIGTFQRPNVDAKSVDVRSRMMSMTNEVRLTDRAAAKMNSALGVQVFSADKVVFDTHSTLAFEGRSDLMADFRMADVNAGDASLEAAWGAEEGS